MLMFMRPLPGRSSRAAQNPPSATVTRSSAQADQRRRLLRAVGELVAERGYPSVTVELIVKRARVSPNTFYKHFTSKEECFIALFESAVSTTRNSVRERLAAEERTWAEQVVLALRGLIEVIVAEPLIARAVIVHAPSVGPVMAERYEQATRAFVPLFRTGRELHPRGAELPKSIEETLSGAVFWSAYQRLVVGEAEELITYLPVLLELVLRTYLGPSEASRIARSGAPQPALA
jgi:AcrR family transcriptional regulator